jgi:multiple sugar transport system substrate-binding protein
MSQRGAMKMSENGKLLQRRTFLLGAAALAGSAVLAACGSDTPAPTATTTKGNSTATGGISSTVAPAPTTASANGRKVSGSVTMWVYPLLEGVAGVNENLWADISKDFMAKNPGVSVDVQVLPWANRDDKLKTALSAGKGPDVAYLNDDQVPQHVENKALVPLDDILSGTEKNDYLPNPLSTLSYKGSIYSAPILLESQPNVYNTKLFNDIGIDTYPTTWDELVQVAPKFKDKGLFVTYYPGALDESLNGSFYPFLWQAGGQIFNSDGSAAAFDSPEGLDALTFVTQLFQNGYTDKSSAISTPETGQTPLDLSKAALGLTIGNDWANRLNKEWGPGILKVGPPLKRKIQISSGSVAGFSLFSDSKNKDASAAWITYMTSPEVMKRILVPGGYFAPKKSVGSLYANDPILGELEKFLPMMRGGEVHPKARQVISTLAPEVQAAFLGKKSPQQALSDAAKAVNSLIKQG